MPEYCIELGCEKTTSHAYPGGKRLTCKEHHLYGMVNVKNKKCSCGKFALVNGLCTSCARKDGWEGDNHKKCSCGKFALHGDYCRSCFNEKHKIVGNREENMIKNYLKKRFPELCLKTEFRICNYKTDFLFELEELFIAIEHDRNQHKDRRSYPPEREAKRQKEILEELSKKKRTVLVRFNPSNYRVGGKLMKTPLEERFKKLGELIQECISDETKSGIFYLFYDE